MYLQPLHDYARCGGPLRCAYCARILSESPSETVSRVAAEDQFRTLGGPTPPNPHAALETLNRCDPYETPDYDPFGSPADPYRPTTLSAHPEDTEGYDPFGTPPDPYAVGLTRMRKEAR